MNSNQDLIHSKYGYNKNEMILMVFITGITNFIVIPAIIIIKKQHMTFQFNMSIFTLLTSFMYHTLESIDCPFFIISESSWHKLDNVGSIVCFQMLFVSLSDLKNLYNETLLNYFGLLVTLFAQSKSPWDLNYTVGPIFMQLGICIFIIFKRQRLPQLNMKQLWKGLFILLFAIYFFVKSQDEHSDYLRINHGMWHFTIGIFSFYIWQAKLEDEYTWNNFLMKASLPDSSYYKE